MSQPIGELFPRLTPSQKDALRKLRIETTTDLLYHFPSRYGDVSEMQSIASLQAGETAVIFGKITDLETSKAFRKKIPMGKATVEDSTGRIQIVWFNQPYIAKMIPEGALVRVEGKVTDRKGTLGMSNPKVEKVGTVPTAVGNSLFGSEAKDEHTLYPVYPESRGITSNWIYHAIQRILKSPSFDTTIDPIPDAILRKYNLPSLKTALVWIHMPKSLKDAEAARKRFSFEEIFFVQLERQKLRREYEKKSAYDIDPDPKSVNDFINRFPFSATEAQNKAIQSILSDFKRGHPMMRLLEGDVGSGKTAVAAVSAFAVVTTRPKGQHFGTLQVAYMAPTEILAKQHFENFIQYFSHLGLSVGLITGNKCRKFPSKVNPKGWTDISKAQLLKWVANGETPILLGTHALIQKNVKFKHLAYVIIDEQHRFGVQQRKALLRRTIAEQTQNYAENPNMNKTDEEADHLLYKDLTYRIRQVLFNVKKALGAGHKEIIYQRAIEEELRVAKLSFSREKQIPILYRNKKVGTYIPDFVIEDKVILELKALPFVGTVEKKQIWNYLKGSSYKLVLLANFGPRELTIDRIINSKSKPSASVQQSSVSVPHLLSMSATPIPRTLALTMYGDLDLTLLDQMPHGRKPIITEIVLPNEREATYEKIRSELQAGRQAYVICPRIDEPDPDKEMAVQAKSAKAEAARLKKDIFPEYEIGVVHSKMKPAEKDKVMKDFADGKIRILVATSVVEVGVNVPNATVIVIEGAERFGLSQLHQLRGRVIRSNHQAYCFVFSESAGAKTKDRLNALKTAKNGFELAEYDLKLRGPGSLSGTGQWGISDIGMDALQNLKMVEAARTEASLLLESDEDLDAVPLIRERLQSRKHKEVHME